MKSFTNTVAEIKVTYSNKIPAKDRVKVTGSDDCYRIGQTFFPSLDHCEYFYVIYLNRANHVLGFHQISKGGFTGTVVDVKLILQIALVTCACGMIAVHNHPSGNLTPSDADLQVTEKLKQAGKTVDVQLLDHLIITSDGYKSFSDEGIL